MNDKLKSLRASAEYAEEKLVASAQSLLAEALEDRGMNKTDLAKSMSVSKARVSQIFSDNQNFTLRFLASAFHAIGEELIIERSSKKIEVKGLNCGETFSEDSTIGEPFAEIAHGTERLDGRTKVRRQPLRAETISKDELSRLLQEAMRNAILRSGENDATRQIRERNKEELTARNWSREATASNVISISRKRA